ncbi:uncharacterized protein [Rutidosis leptorrhynchoides]|uniref:uncharacterized protein isoform X2 n=1 Tax=Rutidosis leptorrhynchoides TaxID=125765 RepID=UPI003A9953D8
MKKKLDSRFPAARIKKIMQADEDVGKIAMAVPLLVSKALELFLQDLCDRTYEITLQKGAKTLNSVHLKQCVQSFNVFDFLREIVNKVPNLGGTDVAAGEDRSASKRRKLAYDDNNRDSDDEAKKGRLQQSIHTNGSGTGGKRGRGRPRKADREAAFTSEWDFKFLQCSDDNNNNNMPKLNEKDVNSKENHIANSVDPTPVRNFDLNLDLDENGDTPPVVMNGSSADPTYELKPEEYPGWSVADVEKMGSCPNKLSNLNMTVDEEYDDYDEEE